MNQAIYLSIAFIVISCNGPKETNEDEQGAHKEITFLTADNVKIYGDLYVTNNSATNILLFHQGGSNGRAVFGKIIPRLLSEGYNVLSIDNRVGGQMYGSYNRTIVEIEINKYKYCDALPDLEGAIDYINKTTELTGKKVLWGGSYSGALVIKLLATNSIGISSALAFSPSSNPVAVKDCHPNDYLPTVEIPLILLRPQSEMQERSQAQFELAQKSGHETYVAINGTHASSTLVEERVGENVDKTWEVVLDFLKRTTNNK
jgi:alpha/beta superfamily hydrolase